MRSRFSYRQLGVVAAAIVVAVGLTAGTAAAGKKTTASYTCGVSPATVTDGYGYYLVGSGYPAGMGVTVYVADSVQTFAYKGTVNSQGAFSISATASFSTTGTKAMYVNRSGDRKMATYCSSSFLVQ
jgi:hypothetical protein